ncbi:MAG: calcium-binding protein [Moorea sp. SIO3C2]|nr:calcium-binding protein [Moorena sp. SIO3C2]
MVSNDNFADRIFLKRTSVSTTGSNEGFTGEPGEPDHADISSPLNSAWWSWTAPADGIVTIDTFGSNYDTTLAVYTGSAVNSLTEIDSNDDTVSLNNNIFTFQSAVQFTVTAGTTYQIAVDGFSFSTGLIDLNINLDIDDNLILGTSGNDSLFGSVENDQIEGLAGNDTIFGSEGINTLLGGDGNDVIYGGSQLDVISGGSGNDTIFASEGNNEILAGIGDDLIYSGAGNDLINSGSGNDTIFASEGNNQIFAGAGDDLIYGGSQLDVINSGSGNDTIFASEGNNQIFAGDGNDLIYGGSQRDVISAGSGNDTIFASEGNNEIFAGAGDDIIYSGSGNDLINSGSGNDTLWLGGGEDLIVLQSGNGFDTINNFQLGLTTFDVANPNQLSIVDGANGAEISRGGDLLAVVSWTQASTLIDNLDQVFV